MYTWLLPAVKAILPHVGDIVNAALPVFKRRKAEFDADRHVPAEASAQDGSWQPQIVELQEAVSQNAVHIKDLAAQLQQMIVTLEQGVLVSERRYRKLLMISWIGAITGGAALAYLYFAR